MRQTFHQEQAHFSLISCAYLLVLQKSIVVVVSASMTSTESSSSTTTPAFRWCRTCSVESDGSIQMDMIEEPSSSENAAFRIINQRRFDLTKSADWMEWVEHQEDRSEDPGGAGAYDTLRCDIPISPSSLDMPRVWGEKYHLDRLQNSYRSLLEDVDLDGLFLETALNDSRAIMHRLLEEAALAARKLKVPDTTKLSDDSGDISSIILIRLTLLWSTPKEQEGAKKIVVKGHATSTCKPIKIHSSPKPIVVSIAAHESKADDEHVTLDKSLPTRFLDPENKIASWCRIRRQMESSSTYKPPGVDEVLMVRQRRDLNGRDRLEVLEGISSNVFVIYKDGTLRTATEGVLNGFVRHLVLESANECGIKVDPRPIFLDESDQWKEAFITSSSRLIYPISEILIPSDSPVQDEKGAEKRDESIMKVVFHDPVLEATISQTLSRQNDDDSPGWLRLLNSILEKGGYRGV